MVRQCAWCLYLIDNEGERLSPAPVSKLYEATHGICGTCGIEWMEQVMASDESMVDEQDCIFPGIEQQRRQERRESITQLILQLQQRQDEPFPQPSPKPTKKTRLF